jgi:hypothetical protein
MSGLVTVISSSGKSSIDARWLEKVLDNFRSDDVFKEPFLATVIFTAPQNLKIDITQDARDFLKRRGVKRVEIWIKDDAPNPGPYFARSRTLWPASRLYDDTHGAFLHSLRLGHSGYAIFFNQNDAIPQCFRI